MSSQAAPLPSSFVRPEAKLPIVNGMKLPDAEYPLVQAYIDLDAYKNAGSIPAAINQINKDTGNARDDAIDALRTVNFSQDSPGQRLRDWLWPSGMDKPQDKTRYARLQRWMSANLPGGVPLATFLHAPTLAAKRTLAARDLDVP